MAGSGHHGELHALYASIKPLHCFSLLLFGPFIRLLYYCMISIQVETSKNARNKCERICQNWIQRILDTQPYLIHAHRQTQTHANMEEEEKKKHTLFNRHLNAATGSAYCSLPGIQRYSCIDRKLIKFENHRIERKHTKNSINCLFSNNWTEEEEKNYRKIVVMA